MLTTEKKILLVFIVAILLLLYVNYDDSVEYFEKKSKKKFGGKKISSAIGHAKTVKVMNLLPVAPFLAVPFRDHVTQWIVKVPLTPFKAPFIKLPPVKDLYNFLLYKPDILTPVRNQGDCGSCWAFSVCDVLSDRVMIQTGGLFDENLSVQELLSCFNPEENGCEGASPEDAFMYLADTGLTLGTEKSMPYKQGKGGAISSICPTRTKGSQIGVKANSVRSIAEWIEEEDPDPDILKQNILNMKRELILGGPFYCAMTVYDDLFDFTGIQVYKRNPKASQIGGHAIQIIGYCDKGVDARRGFSEDGYWICRNSWGKDWPLQTEMSGYFTIQMGTNMCGIESRCGFAEPELFLERKLNKSDALPIDELRYTSYNEYIED